ncbi:hypothetical protein EGW08_017866 [Elysia chlorotica]|uniref:G-protein coupled receptors family 1 profile domain-containing protein n=1 Tax=Elysia chlorotica TaxID=188477 RepID=A0A3S1BTC0_ELYCH|nr:hypothetical protein EGW08_017866 [Elysia chlorotica]
MSNDSDFTALSLSNAANQATSAPGYFVKPLVSVAVMDMFSVVNGFGLCSLLSFLGVFTNIANIIVYARMGLSETSNINFLALSVLDFFVSLVTFFLKFLYSPVLRSLSTGPITTHISMSLSPAMMSTVGASAMMTALISTERCLCVVFPLKVKTFLTPRRVLYLLLTIVAYMVTFLLVFYIDVGAPFINQIGKQGFYFFCFFAVPSTTCFFIVLLSTLFLVIRLRKNLKWRQERSSQSAKSSCKENKLVRTIIAISTIFIICFFPNVLNFFVQIIHPSFRYLDPYLGTLAVVMFSFSGVTQAISSSINIFFYYRMSSKFKRVFSETFLCYKKNLNTK